MIFDDFGLVMFFGVGRFFPTKGPKIMSSFSLKLWHSFFDENTCRNRSVVFQFRCFSLILGHLQNPAENKTSCKI